jgi:nicotinamidase-related amidase
MKALVVVDMQNDFIDGTLGTSEAQAIVATVQARIQEALDDVNRTLLIFTRDTHSDDYLETQEGKKLPVEHCIAPYEGWQIVEPLVPYTSNAVMINKPTFGSLELPLVIERGTKDKLKEIELCGLCTDICIVTNALILKTHFPEIPVIVNSKLCAGTSPESHQAALDIMKMCQVEVI